MDLYIQRHAIAVDRGTKGYETDSKRPLTGKGAEKMQGIAEGMLTLQLSFDRILSSPFVRARQTAGIVAEVLHETKKLEFTADLEPGGDPGRLIDLIGERHGPDSSILLVGHEPYLSGLISILVAGVQNPSITMKKGGLCKLRVAGLRYGRCAVMEWLLTPHQLRLMR